MALYILVVEDESDVRTLIVEQLRKDGIKNKILEAADPMEALDIYNKNKEKLAAIICDHYMPVQHGMQLCNIVKAERPGIKIILFTGDRNITAKGNEDKVNVVIYKPDGIFFLAKHIRKI
ncbi:MAG: hypothetical protein A2504_03805 [Bdellovibrionales bacterium RIFOXYD12_FULL_39_22]|nr:MAG: hypothetical protein A2385_11555 [Bdellovibrionales bacterium RIFOXYB1_FULL_39_21]OFZ41701.1 MAG: hypothetical protein A2485_01865 [Bdellovibrionales bacterium RIFOXYC12_FULL_39_17]OFZ46101.1 MAG: hypothetical protein A2404_12230 [Bdellovibrionales bacterium RIFOXYC1_FULL_39_130]OFZ74928.1 MAG: hypothetical protein A2560_15270 [Bdellovibrionales bacterium RIFOXYD1_FULL_39_84]OFZ92781.1 MAG: hypothetical protein A2504_03805 [Bdellovibrionales bacterium RIFOXYD12_FULL_39_22]HLE12570.1 re